MNKRTGIIIAIIILVFGGLIGISILQRQQESKSEDDGSQLTSAYGVNIPTLNEIEEISLANNYGEYDLASIIPANTSSGNLPENIKGKSNARVVLYEYADYQCEHCAAMNPYLNAILEEYGDQVALVFRTYIMPYHTHGVITAAAANAAALQGYWAEFKDIVFANQNEWFYAKESEMLDYLDKYFTAASGGKGDLKQFHQDMQSEAVKQKIAFDMGISDKADLKWTPSVYVEDKFMNQKEIGGTYDDFLQAIRDEIDARLSKTAK
jgi:protein-disulfide isomerase